MTTDTREALAALVAALDPYGYAPYSKIEPLIQDARAALATQPAQPSDELLRIRAEAEALRSVMIAAAEEIQAHWAAHCDAEGYGPANLMRRLEEGIPSQYGYTAGDFVRLRAEAEALRKDAERWRSLYRRALNEANGLTNYVEDRPELLSAERRIAKIEEEARAAIAATKEQQA